MPAYRLVLPQLRRPTGAGKRGRISGLVRKDQAGFTLIEVMVAMAVFAIVAIFTIGSLAGGMRGVLLGKRREVATQEANRVLELARSLSYNDLGLVPSPTDPTIAGDTAIVTQNGVKSYQVNGVWEPILWAVNAITHPFNPHKTTVLRGATTLTRYVYVSGVDTNADGIIDVKRVTVRVTWVDNGTTGPVNEVRAQSVINESGVVSTGGTVPLTGTAFASGGSLGITSALLGLTSPLNITLPSSKGTATFRAVSNTNCTTKSATLQATNLVNLEGYSASVTADDDPRTATSSTPSSQSSTGVLTIPAGPVGSLVGTSIGSPVSCEASVNPNGHELGTGSALSAMNAQTNVIALGGLLNWLLTLASVQTQPVTQQINHEIVAGQHEAYSSAGAATGLINVLKIPGVIADGLVRIDALNYGASVRAAVGTPSAGPTVTAPTINLRVFDNGNKLPNGSVCSSHSGGYCIVTVNPSAVGFTGKSIQVSHNFTQLLGLNIVNLIYTINVDILPPTKSPTAGITGPNGEKRWSAEYTPVAVSASLDANILGVSIIDADVDLNTGTVTAQGCAGTTC